MQRLDTIEGDFQSYKKMMRDGDDEGEGGGGKANAK